ncbi:MAG TPA: TetR/AcrR family transcriptional regulator [Actinomycetes bacterium]|jgi:AcrR family transcriptional regulator|nr:TetR/AcrR family transcriptional regulator [Actinomycetes bacterium]
MTTARRPDDRARRYHHGDLPRVLLEAAVEAIAEVGPAALSLRDLARRAGVSHAAPAHHFGDKAGLLTAVATDGFRRLAASLGETYRATGSFLEVGVAYVRFAVTHRAHFEVMFRPELYRTDDPALVQARDAARSMLYPPAADLAGADGDRLGAAVAAWSLVHGLATLWLDRNLPPQLGDDPEQIVREVARHLF